MTQIWNVGYHDIKKGDFKQPSKNDEKILIQCVDPCLDFPIPLCAYPFKKIYQLEFSDVDSPNDMVWPFRCRVKQAEEIVRALLEASENNYDVVVHCMAGVSRSGAIVEFAVNELGFEDPETFRNPNKYIVQLLKRFYTYRILKQ